jgi:CheY-like chemotaxis protein
MDMSYVHGTTKIFGHCLFRWHERQADGWRVVELEPDHCETCVAELRRVTKGEIQVPGRWPTGTRPPPRPAAAEVRVLVVDDDDDARSATVELLRSNGYSVLAACDGGDALEMLRGADPPCIVLLDLSMPVVGGREVLREIRQEESLSSVRVIVVSGDRITAKPTGSDLLLRKPVPPQALLAAVGLVTARIKATVAPRTRTSS